MSLQAENGSILEAKEPIVLDSEGNLIFIPTEKSQKKEGFFRSPRSNVKVVKMNGWWLIPLIVFGGGALIFLGTVFLGAVLVGASLLFCIRWFSRALGLR